MYAALQNKSRMVRPNVEQALAQYRGTRMTENVCLNSIQDVALRTGLSRSKLYTEMAAGRLRSVKVGSRRLIPESALVDYVDSLLAANAA
jgi:excisionase family DNA binding protein